MELNTKLEWLEQLCQIDGVSGAEDRVAEWILAHLPQDCRAHRDARGNLICEKKGEKAPKNKMLFAAHMDEVGFIITYIEESGLLRFDAVGGVDTRVVIGKRVRLESGIPGVVGAKPIHLQSAADRDAVLEYDKLYIDIGAASREEAMQHVQLGDFATFATDFYSYGGGKVASKALDDRVGCLLLLELLHKPLPYDITVAFTAQEEIGGAAGNVAFAVAPDIAVAVEGNTAADVPGVAASKRVSALGKGPVLNFKDKKAIMDRGLFAATKALCEEKGIPYQIKTPIIGANDSASMVAAGSGCRVMAVAVPMRYIHSPLAVMDTADLQPAADLLEAMVARLGEME